jgi:peroxiredoxin
MSQFDVDLLKANGDDSGELPLPGTFVIGRDGVIRFAEAYADHTQRADPARVIVALRGIR